eukprot:m.486219 g.486219  ORF g.486219 m.486219 type:complete len:388 (-) comp57211_c0_seq1:226-1389(-)
MLFVVAVLVLVASASAASSEDLFNAAKGGNLSTVAQVASAPGFDVNWADDEGQTLLHLACKDGDFEVAQFLVAHGASISQTTLLGTTPLHLVTDLPLIQWLVSEGADVNQADNFGFTPALGALIQRNLTNAQWFLDNGADINQAALFGVTPLHIASFGGNLPHVQWLVGHGARIDQAAIFGVTPLHAASLGGVLKLMQSVPGLDEEMLSALQDAMQDFLQHADFLGVMEWLVAQGAKIDQKALGRRNPLHFASLGGNETLAQWLVVQGADIDQASQGGFTPLQLASAGGRVPLVNSLVGLGANISKVDDDGSTALHGACTEGRLSVAALLVGLGADPEVKNKVPVAPSVLSTILHLHCLGCSLARCRLAAHRLMKLAEGTATISSPS